MIQWSNSSFTSLTYLVDANATDPSPTGFVVSGIKRSTGSAVEVPAEHTILAENSDQNKVRNILFIRLLVKANLTHAADRQKVQN